MDNINTGSGHGSFLSEEEERIIEFAFFSLPTAGFEKDLQCTCRGLGWIVQLPTALWFHFFETIQWGVEVVRLDLTPDSREPVKAADNKVEAKEAKKTQKPYRVVHVGSEGENSKQIGGSLPISLTIPLD